MSRFQSNFTTPVLAFVIIMILAGCGTTTSTAPQPIPPTPVPVQPTGTVESAPVEPTATAEVEPVATKTTAVEPTATTDPAPDASPTPEAATPPMPDDSGYTDDRSNAETLIESFVNALNRKEYLRAYSYWDEDRAETWPPLEKLPGGISET